MEAYRAAWISNVPSEVAALFTEDAVYSVSPFTEPWIGRDEIVLAGSPGSSKTSS